jgi:hypothetical protein
VAHRISCLMQAPSSPRPAKQNGTEESVVSGRNTAVVKNKTDFLHGMSVSLAEYLVLARDKTRSLTIKV